MNTVTQNPFAVAAAPQPSPINYEPKCLCVLCLDTSSSMEGSAIAALNQGLQVLADELQKDSTTSKRVEICIITFDSQITCVQEPMPITVIDEQMNGLMPQLRVKGTTKLVDGMRAAMAKVEERKRYYRETGQSDYFRPVIMLITDGAPDRDQDIEGLRTELQDAQQRKKFMLLPVVAGDAVPTSFANLCYPTLMLKLKGLEYVELFKWLSNSISKIGNSGTGEMVRFDPTDPWSGGVFSQTTA